MKLNKICSKCKTEKNISEFKPYTHKHHRTGEVIHGVVGQCNSCRKENQIKYKRKKGVKQRIYRGVHNCSDILLCTKCNETKPKVDFRIRSDRKMSHDYYNPTCRECDLEIAAKYYNSKKENAEFKEKNRKRAKAYIEKNTDQIRAIRKSPEYLKKHAQWEIKRYHKVKDLINAKRKIERQTPEYKEYRKKYIAKNKEKISIQEAAAKKRYHEKHRDGLTDEYVIRQLITQEIADREILKIHPEIIEAKRLQLLITRKIKNNGNQNNVRLD